MCRNEILVFLGSAHFPYRVKMRSFQNVFSKIRIFRVLRQQFLYFVMALKSKSEHFLGFSKEVSDEHTCHFYINSAPGDFVFHSR